MDKVVVVVLLAFVALGLLFLAYSREEKFASKQEKARTISEWFHQNVRHSYDSFRSATGGRSNIVEYEDAMKLHARGALTPTSIEKIL